jgi:hypothetical protein
MKKTKKSAFFLTLIITLGMIGMFPIIPRVLGTTDVTVLSPSVGESLIYKEGSPSMGWKYSSFNVTWKGETVIDYFGPQTALQVNATRYNWDILTEQWQIDEDRWDEEEEETVYAFINKSIGGGNDEGHLVGMEEELFNLVYPVGWTGDDLNSSYYLTYSSIMGLSESETGSNWLKLSHSTENVYFYFELDTSTGLLTNFTMDLYGMQIMWVNSSLSELPVKGTSPFNYPSTGGIIYEVFSGETTMGVGYESYNVTGEEFIKLEDSGMFAWVINATKYNWVKETSSWVESDEEGASGPIGAANGVQNYPMEGGLMNMIWGEGTTGADIDNAYNFMIMVYSQQFDTVVITTNSTLYTNSTNENLIYLELFSNGNVYNMTFHGDMGFGAMELTYLYKTELPDSAYLHVPDAPVLITDTQTIITDHLLIEWDAAEGANSYTLIVDGTPVLTDTGDIYYDYTFAGNGTYIITVTAKNEDGESVASDPITITVEIPPADVPEPPTITTSSRTIDTNSITINWGAVTDADSYGVYVDNVHVGDTTSPSHYLEFDGNGSYTITVTATNEGGESEKSDPITITVEIPPVDVPPDDNGDGFEIPGYDSGIVLLMIVFGIGVFWNSFKKRKKL